MTKRHQLSLARPSIQSHVSSLFPHAFVSFSLYLAERSAGALTACKRMNPKTAHLPWRKIPRTACRKRKLAPRPDEPRISERTSRCRAVDPSRVTNDSHTSRY